MAERSGADNLRPFGTLSAEEAFAIRSAGGKAAHARRREKFQLRKALQTLIGLPASEDGQRALEALGYPEAVTQGAEAALAVLRKAQGGDVEAFRVLRDSVGERPAQGVEVSTGPQPGELAELSAEELEALRAQVSGDGGGG